MKELSVRLTGTSPILLSSDRLADPLDPKTIAHKQLTSKKKKTEGDYRAIARSQWEGLLYLDKDNNVVLPTANIRASLVNGGKVNKLGMLIKKAVIMMDEHVPLNYGKKLSIDELWNKGYCDRRSVVVNRARVMAYRPKFTEWSVDCSLIYDINTLDEYQIMQSFENAGMYCGICGYRPELGGSFGRFEVSKI